MDNSLNKSLILAWRDSEFRSVMWSELCVGDVIKINADESFPADCVLLQSSGALGVATIETANLDGETNLKVKQAAPETWRLTPADASGSNWPTQLPCTLIESSAPSRNLEQFKGSLLIQDREKVPLAMNQLLLRVPPAAAHAYMCRSAHMH